MWRARCGHRHDQIVVLLCISILCLPLPKKTCIRVRSVEKRGALRSNGVLGLETGTIKFNRHDQIQPA